MTEKPPDVPGGAPTAPKVPTVIIILALAVLLGYILFLDSGTDESYKYVEFGLLGLMAGVAGVDISRFGRGGDK